MFFYSPPPFDLLLEKQRISGFPSFLPRAMNIHTAWVERDKRHKNKEMAQACVNVVTTCIIPYRKQVEKHADWDVWCYTEARSWICPNVAAALLKWVSKFSIIPAVHLTKKSASLFLGFGLCIMNVNKIINIKCNSGYSDGVWWDPWNLKKKNSWKDVGWNRRWRLFSVFWKWMYVFPGFGSES